MALMLTGSMNKQIAAALENFQSARSGASRPRALKMGVQTPSNWRRCCRRTKARAGAPPE